MHQQSRKGRNPWKLLIAAGFVACLASTTLASRRDDHFREDEVKEGHHKKHHGHHKKHHKHEARENLEDVEDELVNPSIMRKEGLSEDVEVLITF